MGHFQAGFSDEEIGAAEYFNKKEVMDKLTERGFVSMIGNKPYWVMRNQFNQPWLWGYNIPEGKWVSIRQLAEADVAAYLLYKISEVIAQTYHDQNDKNLQYDRQIPIEDYPVQTKDNFPAFNDDPYLKGEFDKIKGSTISDPFFIEFKGEMIEYLSQSSDFGELLDRLFNSMNNINTVINISNGNII